MTTPQHNPREEGLNPQLIRLRNVLERTGLGRSSIYALVKMASSRSQFT